MARLRNSSDERIRLGVNADGARMNDDECCCEDAPLECCSTASITIDGVANDGCDNCTDLNATHVLAINGLTANKCIGGETLISAIEFLCGSFGGGDATGYTLYIEFDASLSNYLFVDFQVWQFFSGIAFPVRKVQRWSTNLDTYPFCDGREYALTLESESGSDSIRCDISGVSMTVTFG